MEPNSSDFLLLFVASFALTGALTPLMKIIALRFGVLDTPTQAHKTHVKPIPYLGGVAIVIATVFVSYGALLLSNFARSTLQIASTVIVPAILMALIGLIDDVKRLQPWPRFIAQNLIALISAAILVSTDTLGSPTGLFVVDLTITILWLVGVTNAINFFDNVDGGASGTVAISATALTLLAIINGQYLIASLSIVLAGSTLGFLIWNKPPARIYMGDAGALFLGILIASLAIRLDSTSGIGELGLLYPFLILAVPILDTSVAVLKRLYRGISPFQGGRDHLSHRLIRLGLNKRDTVLALWIASAIFSLIAISMSVVGVINHNFIAASGVFLWLLLFVFFLRTSDE